MKVPNLDIDTLCDLRDALDTAIRAMTTIESLEAERDEWQKKYTELLTSSIKHGESMMANTLRMILDSSEVSPDEPGHTNREGH